MKETESADNQILEHSTHNISLLMNLANGELHETNSDGVKIYSTPPNLIAITYLINQCLGYPGAKPGPIPFTREMLALAFRDVPQAQPFMHAVKTAEDLDKRVADFLPTAFARLMELGTGVTVRRTTPKGKSMEIESRPVRRALEHVIQRIYGSESVMSHFHEAIITACMPDPTRDYTNEDYNQMTTAQLIALHEAIAKSEKEEAAAKLQEEDEAERPDPERVKRVEASIAIITPFLPTAIRAMQTLAYGAVTVICTEDGERQEIHHAPDPRAAIFLLQCLYGGRK